MRPSSRQRLAAWLLALPSERGGECAYRGRLEMISFWLLCWKLLRATTGLRRTTAELTDGNHDNSNSDNSDPVNDLPTPLQPTDSVTMEISSSAPLTDLGVDDLVSWRTQDEQELRYPDIHGMHQPMREEEDAGNGDGKTDGDECDYLVFDIGERKGGVDVDESKGGTKKGVEEEEGGGRGGRDKEDGEGGKLEVEHGSKGDTESGEWCRRETEGGVEIKDEDEGVGETEEERRVGYINDDPLAEFLFSGSPASLSSSEPMNYTQMSNRAWGHDHGNRDDLSDGQLSDCLQAELAMVYSDSDAGEDQMAAFVPCNATNQEEAGGGSHNSLNKVGRGAEMEEEDEVKVEIAGQREEEGEKEERSGGRDDFDDDEEQMGSRRDLFLQSPSASSTASSTDADKKVPQDFSVHQDTLSENVSTEHVDFLLARQQWRKMEEEVKGQPIPKPGLRTQGSFRGTHTSLYPPTRSPRLKHRELHQSTPQEPPLSSTLSPSSEDSGLDDPSYRGPPEEPESAVEREIRLTLEREERHRRERGLIAQGLPMTRPSSLQTGRSPPRPPACRTPTLSISPSPSCSSSLPRSAYHEMTANNVIILEPECSGSTSRNRLISTAIGGLSDWPSSLDTAPSGNVIVVETSNLIIRSASEFCLSSAPVSMETQESTFSSNPFFKLRSLSSQSLVEREIRMVRQREEEWRRQREGQWRRGREEEWKKGRERYDTVLVSPGLNDNITFSVPEVPDRCVSSPSSPSRTRKIERSSLSCDHKNTMAQRWEASLLANQKKE